MESKVIPNSANYDFNHVIDEGIYCSESYGANTIDILNSPSGIADDLFSLEVVRIDFGTYGTGNYPIYQVKQTLMCESGMFVRFMDAKGNWHDWAKLIGAVA